MRNFLPIAFVLTLVIAAPAKAMSLSDSDRLSLQAAMVQHIDRQTIDGVYPWVDLKSGVINKYAPAKSHPMIVRMGDNFVLCTDFKDASGASTNVDFYVARKGKSFVVVRAEVANREPLMDLMKAGKAQASD